MDGRVVGCRFRSNGRRPDCCVYFLACFVPQQTKRLVSGHPPLPNVVFIIESEANLLQLFIHQWKTSAALPKHECVVASPWELKGLIMQLFSMSSQRFLNKNVLTIVSVECSKKIIRNRRKISLILNPGRWVSHLISSLTVTTTLWTYTFVSSQQSRSLNRRKEFFGCVL